MEHPGVNLGSKEVVGGRDGVDVPRQVQVEVLHGDHLGVPAPGCPAYREVKGHEDIHVGAAYWGTLILLVARGLIVNFSSPAKQDRVATVQHIV